MRIFGIVAISLAVLCMPVAMGAHDVFDLGDYGAAHAKNGNNGKSDNGKGGGNGGGKDRGDKSDKSDKSAGKAKGGKERAASRSSSGNAKQGGPKKLFDGIKSAFGGKKTVKVKKAKPVQKQAAVKKAPKTNGKKAALAAAAATGAIAGAHPSDMKALNSLNRNINGMMNSSDPKMEPFREFIRANAELQSGEEYLDLVAAQDKLAMSQDTYAGYVETYGLDPDPVIAAEQLENAMTAHLAAKPETDDPNDPDLIAWEAERKNLEDAATALETVEADKITVDEAQDAYDVVAEAAGADDAALTQAIVDSINQTGAGPVTVDDIPEAMFDKVAAYMGVGEAHGFIDEYAAQMETADAESEDDDAAETDETEGETEGEEESPEEETAELLIEPAAA